MTTDGVLARDDDEDGLEHVGWATGLLTNCLKIRKQDLIRYFIRLG